MRKISVPLRAGFTLVEVIVVVGIISILAAVVIANLSQARAQSRDKMRISDIEQARLTFRLYLEQAGLSTYPNSSTYDGGVEVGVHGGLNSTVGTVDTLPTDPKSGTTGYGYFYDSDYSCNSSSHIVLYINQFESGTGLANEDQVCGTSGSGKYVIVLE